MDHSIAAPNFTKTTRNHSGGVASFLHLNYSVLEAYSEGFIKKERYIARINYHLQAKSE